ncbi:MAG: DegQ family serine endoprotease [Gammaproteobacteria bacterium]
MLKKIYWPFFLIGLIFNQAVWAQLPDFTELVKKCGAAVVNVSTTQKAPDLGQQQLPDDLQIPEGSPFEDFFRHFFQGPGGPGYVPRETKSLGSGFIISSDGYILTNHHVVKNADEIVVKLQDRRELEAKLIGSDPRTDIALLKVKANGLPLVRIGSADRLQVGEWVLAIGSPFGFESSVTAGIVSAKGRSLPGDNYVPFIQTDVAINPGNSGGPLFNMEGEVVGINSQIYSRTGGFMGLSFAIPIDVALNVVEQLKTTGKVSRGWLGVQIQDVTRELAESFNMDRPHGALVAKVIPGSPAEKAGLQIGDVIVEFNGQVIETSSELPPLVGMTPVGKAAVLKLIRQGKREELSIDIGLLPEEEEVALASGEEAGAKTIKRLGIAVSELSADQREQLQVMKDGVLVQQVSKGAAADAGIERGDVILRVGNNVVRDVADFAKIIADIPAGKSIAVLIQRRGSPVFLAIKLDK